MSPRPTSPRSRAELLGAGLTRYDLESVRWTSPHRGYHREQLPLVDEVRQRVVDAAAVMPDSATIGGWAAGYLQGASYLDGHGKPVLVVLPPDRIIRREGIVTIRTVLAPEDRVVRYGIPCTSGVRTAYDLLRMAQGLTAAVVAGDCVLHAGLTTKSSLTAYLDAYPGRRGVRQLRAALSLVDPAAASPPETRLRLLCLDAGLPPMLVNVPIHDLAGNFLGIPDLLEPVSGLVIEYDGAHHRELGQHTADNAREERFEANGLMVVRVTALDMRNPITTQARIRSAYERCLVRDKSADSWIVLPRDTAA